LLCLERCELLFSTLPLVGFSSASTSVTNIPSVTSVTSITNVTTTNITCTRIA
jgi:hypothetical protein